MKPRRSRVSAYALIHDSNRILLCRLSKELPRWEGCWTLPGGGLDFGESPEQAVVREVEEETGLRVEVRSIAAIDSIHDTSGTEDFHGIRIIYHVDLAGGSLRHEASGSTDRCEWHRLHPSPDIPLVDLVEVGLRVAQQVWPLQPPAGPVTEAGGFIGHRRQPHS
ncbi:MAG: NUDIX domain-containing protein [Verrucomicrobiota bacterium]